MTKLDTREKLIAAGLTLLHARGFNGCGVQDITVAAGVPKGSFYNYFVSKSAFALEVLERYWQGLRLHLKPLRDPDVAPAERLRRYFAGSAGALIRWEFEKGCMIGNFGAELSDQDTDIRVRIAAIMAEWGRAVEACLRDAQATGTLRPELDPAVLAPVLVNAWEGTVLRAKVDKTARAFDDFLTILSTMFAA